MKYNLGDRLYKYSTDYKGLETLVISSVDFNTHHLDTGSHLEDHRYKERFASGDMVSASILVTIWDRSSNLCGTHSIGDMYIDTTKDIGEQVRKLVRDYGLMDEALEDLLSVFEEISI